MTFKSAICRGYVAVLLSLTILPLFLAANYPQWWLDRGVVISGAVTNDFGVVNQGQVKQIATKAYEELQAKLSGGAGSNLTVLIQSFSLTNANYAPVNIGQLKNVAKPFYDRLIEVGYTNAYPWPESSTNRNDYAMANIGQVKYLFSFDLNNLGTTSNTIPDWWLLKYFGNLNQDPNGDPDGDGFTTLQEYQMGTDPTHASAYPLTLTVGVGGSVTGGSNGVFYPPETVLTLTATADSGFNFMGWSGDVTGTNNTVSLTMDWHKWVTANFLDMIPPTLSITNPIPNSGGDFTSNVVIPSGLITDSGDLGWTGGPTLAYQAGAAIDGVLTWSDPSTLTDGLNHQCILSTAMGWLQYDFGVGNEKVIQKYRLSSSLSLPDRAPKAWRLEGSADGVTWATLDTQSNQISWTRGTYNSYEFSNSTAYRYYRLNISENNGSGVTDLDEWQMMEKHAALYQTTEGTVTVSGVASDNGPFTLSWENLTSGESGQATGTTNDPSSGVMSWNVMDLPLVEGTNVLQVTATDTGGNTASDTLEVSTTATGVLGVIPTNGLDFGNIAIGITSNLFFTLTNSGIASLIGNVSIESGPFNIVGPTNYYLPAYDPTIQPSNNITTITVQYAPLTNGTFTNIVTFTGGGGATRWVTGNTPLDANGDNIPDSWEYQYFGTNYLSGGIYGPNGDPDGDGLSNLQEYQSGSNPTDYYNGTLPILTIVSGNNQTGPLNAFLSQPLIVQLNDPQSGAALTNAPVTFMVTQGNSQLSVSTNGDPLLSSIALRSDGMGQAQVFEYLSTTSDPTNLVTAIAQSGTNSTQAVFTLTVNQVSTPTFNPDGGNYNTSQNVTITGPTEGATIYFTTNSMDPNQNDSQINSGSNILIDQPLILKARAWKSDSEPSDIKTAVYQIPSPLSPAVSAGFGYAAALDYSGNVWTWGLDNYLVTYIRNVGQLGNGSSTEANPFPTQIIGLNGVTAISAGGAHMLVRKSDGTVWGWGGIGVNGISSTNIPIQVNGLTNITMVAAGAAHSLALAADSTVWAWGYNANGQLGNGTNLDSNVPIQIPGLSNVTMVATEVETSLALKSDRSVWEWGSRSFVSNGFIAVTVTKLIPTQVPQLSNVVAVSDGLYHSLALKADGTVWAWGENGPGLFGNGTSSQTTNANQLTEVVQVNNLTNIVSISAGAWHSLAIASDGRLWAWGRNDRGQIGDGSTTNVLSPVYVSQLTNVIACAASAGRFTNILGYDSSYAVTADGVIWAWGANLFGELGLGTIDNDAHPIPTPIGGIGPIANSDADGDGLPYWKELQVGTDPNNPDTNGDGIPDGVAVAAGISPTNMDMDGDGLTNAQELQLGTDPFNPDTDGDGVPDGQDAFPLDPTRWQLPSSNPNDHTPPTITLDEPADAILIP